MKTVDSALSVFCGLLGIFAVTYVFINWYPLIAYTALILGTLYIAGTLSNRLREWFNA